MEEIEGLLTQLIEQGFIYCGKCGNAIEGDLEKCVCGELNPIFANGMI